MIAWSWSRLNDFETCPKMFQEKNILKRFPFKQNEQAKRGERIHKQIENGIKGGFYHEEIAHLTPSIDKIRGTSWDEFHCEYQICLDKKKSDVPWFSKDAWLRVQTDFIGIKGDTAIVYDWKTGKVKGYTDQLKLNAAAVFHKFPQVEKISSAYVFVDHKKKEDRCYKKDESPALWQEFEERAELIQICEEKGDWPVKPSQQGCQWCPVNDCKDRVLLKR